jgi:predicted transcriptional regulator
MKAREKEKQFPGSVVMIDESNILAIAWGLGAGVVVVVGKDSKIKLIKTIKTQTESRAVIQTVQKVVQGEIAK